MNMKGRTLSTIPLLVASLFVGGCLLLSASSSSAAVKYMADGALQNAGGGWDLPQQGSCTTDPAMTSRPDCLSLRLNETSGTCSAAGGSWSTSVCNDTLSTDQATCEGKPNRRWSAASNTCAVVLKDEDRYDVVCMAYNGTWGPGGCVGVWLMPNGGDYTPPVLNRALDAPASSGDQCLRCHNSVTQYNGPRIRDVESTLHMGHKNMARKVVPGSMLPWAGPDGLPYVANDSGALFDWNAGTVGGVDVKWIYGDWLGPLPRTVRTGDGYTCARCHMTGYVGGVGPLAGMEPLDSFPDIAATNPSITDVWDQFGITCSRCHNSAVDTDKGTCGGVDEPTCTGNGGTWSSSSCTSTEAQCTTMGGTSYGPPYGAPDGMSTHHNDLTSVTVSTSGSGDKGYCTNPNFTREAQCDAAGAAWLTQCSIAGECDNPAYTTSGACFLGGGAWTRYVDSTTCTTNGGTWQPSGSCSVAGICNDPAMTTQATCTGTVVGGDLDGLVRQWKNATDIIRCEDVGGEYTGNKTNRGQVILALCMNCHRQETGGNPYDAADPAGDLKVGPGHGGVGFVSHPHGNMFLNSTHGQYTGTFDEIALATTDDDYGSHFMNDGEAANTGNGCTGCHNVHKSTVEAVGADEPVKECTECHGKNLAQILHPAGGGTPLENMATDPAEACEICHMPEGLHLFRINADETYSTIPMPAALTATVAANTSPDGDYASAVWVDLDAACGQCHGGGDAQASTTGDTTSGSDLVAVDNTAGFEVGARIVIPGAGALEEDGVTREDLETYVREVHAPAELRVAGGNLGVSLVGATIVQNPTKNGAGYMTKADLAVLAEGIHNDAPTVTFGYMLDKIDTLTVWVDASGSSCSGGPCNRYSWDWGDGNTGSGVTASHTYATAGSKTITLTVRQYGVSEGSASKNVTVYAPDLPPTVAGVCSFDANTWVATVTDTSSDDNGIAQVTVGWGDGTMLSDDKTAPFGPFTHTYAKAGTFTIRHKAIDTLGQQATTTCVAAAAYFGISGTVYQSDGITPVARATVKVKKGGKVVKTAYTKAVTDVGQFAINFLKPGTYDIVVTKSGYTFASPAATVTIGPDSAGNDIDAVTP